MRVILVGQTRKNYPYCILTLKNNSYFWEQLIFKQNWATYFGRLHKNRNENKKNIIQHINRSYCNDFNIPLYE